MGNNAFKTVAFWFGLALLLLFMMSYVKPPQAQKSKEPNYSEFMDLVAAQKVESAVLMPLKPELGNGYFVKGVGKDKAEFELMVPQSDQDLFAALRKGGVSVSIKPIEATFGDRVFQFLISWGPILLLVFVWFFLMNRMQGGGPGGAMAFGKSKAKMLQGAQGKVTFA